jgi:hypothetical protein
VLLAHGQQNERGPRVSFHGTAAVGVAAVRWISCNAVISFFNHTRGIHKLNPRAYNLSMKKTAAKNLHPWTEQQWSRILYDYELRLSRDLDALALPISLPVAAALGASTVVVENPEISRRQLFSWQRG